ncbi:MAG: hypothetical protein OEQ29_09555 [Alphaproteobacteria bacterium]|nr:hypothetical protein [Alphaproteobacteria bacterium]
MSLHYGIATKLDFVTRLRTNEKIAWQGHASTLRSIHINEPELHGGVKKEGGAIGTFTFMPGDAAQTTPEVLANKLGRTNANCPGFRGTSTFWLTETLAVGEGTPGGGHAAGFYLSANSPFLPRIDIQGGRASLPLGEDHARIWRRVKENLIAQTADPSLTPWSFGAAPILVTDLADPFGGTKAFSLEDDQGPTAEGYAQDMPTGYLKGRRGIYSIYVLRDIAEDVFSAIGFRTDTDNSWLLYDHRTDEIATNIAGGPLPHILHDSGVETVPPGSNSVGGPPHGNWRRIYFDIEATRLVDPEVGIYPARGDSDDFPSFGFGAQGTVTFYGPQAERSGPVC